MPVITFAFICNYNIHLHVGKKEKNMIIPADEDLIIEAVEKVGKSVVNIASVRMVQDQLFRLFPIEGVGSGIIIDSKGLILTNNHVVDKANNLKITLKDGNIFNGKVIGTDEATDLAVVKVDSTEALPQAQLGDSDNLKIGPNSGCNW